MWSSEEPCVVELITAEDLMKKLVYTATNPVKDHLVERVHQWPGPKFVQALRSGTVMRAKRPRHFFRQNGTMPESVELKLGLPENFPNREEFLAELERRIAAEEERITSERRKTGRGVVGRSRILRQSWRDTPTSFDERRGLRPRVAAGNKWARIAALQRNKEFGRAHKSSRLNWLAGIPTVFPFGTYWLKRFANVPVEPAPPFPRFKFDDDFE